MGCNSRELRLVLFFFIFTVVACKEEVCYEPLGCFQTDGPWFSLLLRPCPAPQAPKDIDTKIYYFNRENKEDGVGVYKDLKISMDKSGFDTNRNKTFFIVHGYLASGNSSWMSNLKDIILNKMDANVFLVDWGKGADKINYFQVASNTRVVGAEITRFIKHLEKEHKLKPSDIHLIGHSLGAHTSAYVAKNVKGISRLTGLDAAQPAFEGLPKEVRIDESDAKYVELIHTNIRPTVPTLGFGMIQAVGAVDIYMNGGLDQPGCYTPDGVNKIKDLSDIGKVPFSVLSKWISCSHSKAYEYFSASLTAKCKTWGRSSGRVRSIVNAITLGNVEPITASIDKCSADTCIAMGWDTPKYKARGVFAATTVRQYPYCDEDPEYDKEVARQIETEEEEMRPVSRLLGALNV